MAENEKNRSIWPAVAIGSVAAIEAGHFFYSGCVWSTATHSLICGDGTTEVFATIEAFCVFLLFLSVRSYLRSSDRR